MANAARNLTPVTLELGGKSPAIVAPDFPIGTAAERILWAKSLNAGIFCLMGFIVAVLGAAATFFVFLSHKAGQASKQGEPTDDRLNS